VSRKRVGDGFVCSQLGCYLLLPDRGPTDADGEACITANELLAPGTSKAITNAFLSIS